MMPELQGTLEITEGMVRIRLLGALRAAAAAGLEELMRARDDLPASYPVVADLSGLEVADDLGLEALGQFLSRFVEASVVLPPPWTQACRVVHAHLTGPRLLERLSELERPAGAERRRHRRVVPRFLATLDLGNGRVLDAVAADLSRGGARFAEVRNSRVLNAAELEALVGRPLHITIADLGVRHTSARVVHLYGRPLGLGVTFRRLGPGPLRRIACFETFET